MHMDTGIDPEAIGKAVQKAGGELDAKRLTACFAHALLQVLRPRLRPGVCVCVYVCVCV